jgi:hypothetical protein
VGVLDMRSIRQIMLDAQEEFAKAQQWEQKRLALAQQQKLVSAQQEKITGAPKKPAAGVKGRELTEGVKSNQARGGVENSPG